MSLLLGAKYMQICRSDNLYKRQAIWLIMARHESGLKCKNLLSNSIKLRRSSSLGRNFRYIWSLKRALRLRRDPRQMSALTRRPINNSRVRGDPVIPNDNCLRCPSNTSLIIDSAPNVTHQECKQCVAFFLLEAINASCD